MGICLSRRRNTGTPAVQGNIEVFHVSNIPEGALTQLPPSYEESVVAPSAPPRDLIQGNIPSRLLVAAIDFGTTFSGYAFSFRHDYNSDPLKISHNLWQHSNGMSRKAPTAVLIGPDLKVKSFGYDAERDYADIAETDEINKWYYFHRFKMRLYQEQHVTVNTMLADINGKQLPAIDVFSVVIGYIKNHLLARLHGMDTNGYVAESSIHWVLTVPAIWNDKSKQFMRKAAQKAGIQSEHLTLSLEPEAASLFCRCLPAFNNAATPSGGNNQLQPLNKGTKYMILDLGGGTVDVTVHEIQSDGFLQECHQASGGYWGGTTVDQHFYSVLTTIFGQSVIRNIREFRPHDVLELQTEFEVKKRTFTSNQTKPVIIRIPVGFVEVLEETTGRTLSEAIDQSEYHEQLQFIKDKLYFKTELFAQFFTVSVSCIINHIQELLSQPHLADISTILLIGGYSECYVVKDTIVSRFPQLRVIHPDDSGLAVLKGAVLFGHEPRAISSRVCKYTYGIAMTLPFREGVHPEDRKRQIGGIDVCDDIYDIHLRIGQKVKINEDQPVKEYNLIPGQTKGILEVFASSKPNPMFVTDESCTFLGSVYIENPEGFQNSGKIFVKLLYEGTELTVEAREEKTGKLTKACCDFLG